MLITTSTVIKNLVDKPFVEDGKDLTVGMVIAGTLATVKSGDPLKSWLLATKFYNAAEVEVTAEDIVFIKDRLKESQYFPIIMGPVLQALDV